MCPLIKKEMPNLSTLVPRNDMVPTYVHTKKKSKCVRKREIKTNTCFLLN